MHVPFKSPLLRDDLTVQGRVHISEHTGPHRVDIPYIPYNG